MKMHQQLTHSENGSDMLSLHSANLMRKLGVWSARSTTNAIQNLYWVLDRKNLLSLHSGTLDLPLPVHAAAKIMAIYKFNERNIHDRMV